MRNLFALIGFAVVAFAVIGWYSGWYQLTLSKGEGGKAEIKTVVDTRKVTEDSTAFFQKVAQIISNQANVSSSDGETNAGNARPTVPPQVNPGTGPSVPALPGGNTPLVPASGVPAAPPVSIPPSPGGTTGGKIR
ncbi:MAG: hypothetical protein NZ703_14345 [Gemmataceae bacterium]|nr:hypothetical protein [Gemmataceae bacterium]MCS7272259.1 hypothetical protein [Gemmataceae bacterium]